MQSKDRNHRTGTLTHTIEIADSDIRFEAHATESVLDAALRLGLPVPYGCQTGHCGACRAHVASGSLEYPDGPPAALSEDEHAADLVLLCQAHATSNATLDVSLLAPDGHLNARNWPARLEDKQWLAHDVIQVQLQLPQRRAFDWLPGQYVDILLNDGQRRSFSIANVPNDKNVVELQLRLVPGGSFVQRVAHEMEPGEMLRLRGPLGGFYWRDAPDRPAVLIAGGTGFAPIRAILTGQLTAGQTKPLHLYWGARAERDLYDAELAQQWAAQHDNLTFTPVLSEPGDDTTARTGFVHEAVAADFPDCSGLDVYMSGPPVMVNAAKDVLVDQGLRPDRTFYDAFEYAHVTWPSAS